MKLAIKGHKERGKEVIKLLEMLGGKSVSVREGIYDTKKYYIANNGEIHCAPIHTEIEGESHLVFTLEAFENRYPYKLEEKVLYLNGRNEWLEGIIYKMLWNENNDSLYYYVNNIDGTSAGQATTMFLKPMKKKELKDYLKPGYVVEYEEGNKFVITQDVHGNVFGIQIGEKNHWASLDHLDYIVAVYQINKPTHLHRVDARSSVVTKVWEKPKEVELTMQQIADKFGIEVNQLKIKK